MFTLSLRSCCLKFLISSHLQLCHDLGSSLKRLLFLSNDDFWRMGWIYARVQHHIVFIYNGGLIFLIFEKLMLVDASASNFLAITSGQVVLNKSLVMERPSCSRIVSVTPIAVPPSSCVYFEVKGSNLVRSTTRFIIPFF